MESDNYRNELKKFLTNGSAIISALIVKRLTEVILESVFNKMVPDKPDEDKETGWIEALAWAAFTGALAGTLRLLVKRGTKITLDKVM